MIGRDAQLSRQAAAPAAAMVAMPAGLMPFMSQPDGFGLFMTLGALALWLCARGAQGDRRAFVFGGLVVGLATLTRSDGALLGLPFALMLPFAMLQIGSASREASARASTMKALPAHVLGALHYAGVAHGSPIITDRPVWVADALLKPAIVLPDESVDSVLDLAHRFGAQAVVVFESRGDYPAAMRSGPDSACFSELEGAAANGPAAVATFLIRRECTQ